MPMDTSYLTPHQMEPRLPYLDTLALVTYDPLPLDVASPQTASLLIVGEIGKRLAAELGGRLTLQIVGDTLLHTPVDDGWLDAYAAMQTYPVRLICVLTDRNLTTPCFSRPSSDGRQLVGFDWWQWVRLNVPERRWTDAWLFLCCAIPAYRSSDAFQETGFAADVLEAMAAQGEQLFTALLADLAQALQEAWSRIRELPGVPREAL